ncbi:MAG: PH domain-containing protein [Oligoflexia bacterium]|nr:PH domain-containing protein [Oligoflexia bacterium]
MSEIIKEEARSIEGKRIYLEYVHVRKSLSLLTMRLITLELLYVLSVVILHASLSVIQSSLLNYRNIIIPRDYFDVGLITYKVILMIYMTLQWQNEKYTITTAKIIHERGIFFKKKEMYDYSHITLIDIKQGILGKIFNFGSIHLSDPFINKDIYLDDIHNPERYYHILRGLSPKIDATREVVQGEIIKDDEDEVFENIQTYVTTFSGHKKTMLT